MERTIAGMVDPEGSEWHIRWYVNSRADLLDAAIYTALPSLATAATGQRPDWRSPCPPDFEELCNERFIKVLDLDQHLDAFRGFWPFSGRGTPNWDAAAVVPLVGGDGVVLVEAKAHIGEFDKHDDKSGAKDETSKQMIDDALMAARRFYTVPPGAPDWRLHYYQVCNRLTHLWWMCTKADMPTWLVWLFIVDDPYWPPSQRFSAALAQTTYLHVMQTVGLPSTHPLDDRIAAVCLPPSPARL
jgi:hypothetical protein